PSTLFNVPYSTVIESSDGRLLDAHIAADDQWRFPAVDSIPYRYKQCLLQYEDAHFYEHPGFNPVSIIHAIQDNNKAGRVVRGGSTITQQVIRLSRNLPSGQAGRNRGYFEKFIELIWATRLELRSSKEDILKLYASHAPYGGNVVGLEMASWRYFGRRPHELSWSESATLAVLPNAPGLIYPGTRGNLLTDKRNTLLLKLKNEGIITPMDYELAVSEEVPIQDFKVPQLAPHLLQRAHKEYGSKKITTTLDYELQATVNRIVSGHHKTLSANGVNNLAMLVLDVQTNSVAAYVGNAPTTIEHGKDVDIITAPRSTGSVLKPFLYATMLDEGELLPHSLVPDIPTTINGFTTDNYDRTYSGAVPASKALSKSLNIPAVRMLQSHGVPRFYNKLQTLKLSQINRGSSTYGLSLIIGGAESSLWDMCHAYLGMATTLKDYTRNSSMYDAQVMNKLHYAKQIGKENYRLTTPQLQKDKVIYGAGAIYHTFESMKNVNRPEGEEIWHFFNPNRAIAWKTGTSFGNRDAWAIGVTPRYVIGVWTGNADGEGRAEMTGIDSAAPVLFDLFNRLPDTSWFAQPYDDMLEVQVCAQSGYLTTDLCPSSTQWIPAVGERFKPCPYHELIHLDTTSTEQVTASCESVQNMIPTPWFTLPPVMSYYYARSHPSYLAKPPFRSNCEPSTSAIMQFIRPKHNTTITKTRNLQGQENSAVFEIAHRTPEKKVFWYLDKKFLGETTSFHEKAINATKGKRLITA
ncbi:MAG: penicillin-binding protein 1C, partial [Nonlabens sp.]|nr:penicillin-binding protein 1C [Nonlabens sp.]